MSKILLIFTFYLGGCGNPVRLEKDLRSEEDRRKDTDERNTKLADDNRALRSNLRYFKDSEHYYWAFTSAFVSYQKAFQSCAELNGDAAKIDTKSWSLPTETERSEFMIQLFPKIKNFQGTVDMNKIHAIDKTKNIDDGLGLCRRIKD